MKALVYMGPEKVAGWEATGATELVSPWIRIPLDWTLVEDWRAHDHAKLTTLVSERPGERGRVEACTACRGYVKTITTLTPCPPADVMLLDLDTVHLDVAAIEHGFQRPRPVGPRARCDACARHQDRVDRPGPAAARHGYRRRRQVVCHR